MPIPETELREARETANDIAASLLRLVNFDEQTRRDIMHTVVESLNAQTFLYVSEIAEGIERAI